MMKQTTLKSSDVNSRLLYRRWSFIRTLTIPTFEKNQNVWALCKGEGFEMIPVAVVLPWKDFLALQGKAFQEKEDDNRDDMKEDMKEEFSGGPEEKEKDEKQMMLPFDNLSGEERKESE